MQDQQENLIITENDCQHAHKIIYVNDKLLKVKNSSQWFCQLSDG